MGRLSANSLRSAVSRRFSKSDLLAENVSTYGTISTPSSTFFSFYGRGSARFLTQVNEANGWQCVAAARHECCAAFRSVDFNAVCLMNPAVWASSHVR
jgi:hypothetical protein